MFLPPFLPNVAAFIDFANVYDYSPSWVYDGGWWGTHAVSRISIQSRFSKWKQTTSNYSIVFLLKNIDVVKIKHSPSLPAVLKTVTNMPIIRAPFLFSPQTWPRVCLCLHQPSEAHVNWIDLTQRYSKLRQAVQLSSVAATTIFHFKFIVRVRSSNEIRTRLCAWSLLVVGAETTNSSLGEDNVYLLLF